MPSVNMRVEHDLLGELKVPADAYYGVQTARALENFRISGVELRLYPNFIKALAMVKLAAARANHDVGEMEPEILAGIEGACHEIIDGKLYIFGGKGSHDAFNLHPRENMALAVKYWNEEVNGSNAFWQRTRRMVLRVPHYKSGGELAAEVAQARK